MTRSPGQRFTTPASAADTQRKIHELEEMLKGVAEWAVHDSDAAEKRERLRQLSGQIMVGMCTFGGKGRFLRSLVVKTWLNISSENRKTILEEGPLTVEDLAVVQHPRMLKALNEAGAETGFIAVTKTDARAGMRQVGKNIGPVKGVAPLSAIEGQCDSKAYEGDSRKGADTQESANQGGVMLAGVGDSEIRAKEVGAWRDGDTEKGGMPQAGTGGGTDLGNIGRAPGAVEVGGGEGAGKSRNLDEEDEQSMKEAGEVVRENGEVRGMEGREHINADAGSEGDHESSMSRATPLGAGKDGREIVYPLELGPPAQHEGYLEPQITLPGNCLKRKGPMTFLDNEVHESGPKRAKTQDGIDPNGREGKEGTWCRSGPGPQDEGGAGPETEALGEGWKAIKDSAQEKNEQKPEEGVPIEKKRRKPIGPARGIYDTPCSPCRKRSLQCEYLQEGLACRTCRLRKIKCGLLKTATGSPYPGTEEGSMGADGGVMEGEGCCVARGEAGYDGGLATCRASDSVVSRGGQSGTERKRLETLEPPLGDAEPLKGIAGTRALPRPKIVHNKQSPPTFTDPIQEVSGSLSHTRSQSPPTPETPTDHVGDMYQTVHANGDNESMEVDPSPPAIVDPGPGPLNVAMASAPQSRRAGEDLEKRKANKLAPSQAEKDAEGEVIAHRSNATKDTQRPSDPSSPLRIHPPPPAIRPAQRSAGLNHRSATIQQPSLQSFTRSVTPVLAQEMDSPTVQQEVVRIHERQLKAEGLLAEIGGRVKVVFREAERIVDIEREVEGLREYQDEINQALEEIEKAQEATHGDLQRFIQTSTSSTGLINAKLRAHESKLKDHNDMASTLAMQMNGGPAVNEGRYQTLSTAIACAKGEIKALQEREGVVVEKLALLQSSVTNMTSGSEAGLTVAQNQLVACKGVLDRISTILEQVESGREADWEKVKAIRADDTGKVQRVLEGLEQYLEHESQTENRDLGRRVDGLQTKLGAMQTEVRTFIKDTEARMLELAEGVKELLSQSRAVAPPQPPQPLTQVPGSSSASPLSIPRGEFEPTGLGPSPTFTEPSLTPTSPGAGPKHVQTTPVTPRLVSLASTHASSPTPPHTRHISTGRAGPAPVSETSRSPSEQPSIHPGEHGKV